MWPFHAIGRRDITSWVGTLMIQFDAKPALALLLGLTLACGKQETSTDVAAEDVEEIEPIPPDAAGVRDHALNRAILGVWWGSGCPDFGACGCGGARDLAQEFTCQMDRLQALDIPVSVYLFDGSAWSSRNSSVTNTCSGSDCCSWKLGESVVQRLSRDRVRALVHFWGGCHANDQYQRLHTRLGRNLLGFYLDDGSSDQDLEEVAGFMRGASPGDWENIAKAYQGREPSTSNSGLSRFANAAYVGDLSYDFAGMREGFTRLIAKARYLPAPYNEFIVPLVTEFTRTLNFRLPLGTWVDYWNEQRTVSGEVVGEPVPLGREPVFLRLGAIIPLEVQREYTGHGTRESTGSLTVLVYPNGTTSFRYYEAASAVWSTFTSVRSGTSITLDAVPGPTVPILYRIGRVTSRPTAVGIEGGTVRVNQSGDLPEVASEAAVNGSTTSAWFYDAPARRLIVKLVR
jgi:hypothetical protein